MGTGPYWLFAAGATPRNNHSALLGFLQEGIFILTDAKDRSTESKYGLRNVLCTATTHWTAESRARPSAWPAGNFSGDYTAP